MATIKQLTKQIETSKKRIFDYERKIAMYQERRDNNIAVANKKFGLNILVEDILVTEKTRGNYKWKEFSLSSEIRAAIGFDAAFKITNACDYIEDNAKNKRYETANLERLETELKVLKEQEQAKKDNYNKGLEAALRVSMEDFRTVWFERMITWHGKHYDYIKDKTPKMKKRYSRVRILQQHFDRYHLRHVHSRIRKYLENVAVSCGNIISDTANRFDTKEEYLGEVKKELENSWENGIVKLTNKCQGFGVDKQKVSVYNPSMTSKGFEVEIKDGKPRIIYARVIWAAEYSMIVEPHIRYIVTERKI